MPTARAIITGALKFGLNRLAPGETLDADLAADCLLGLNYIVDKVDGAKAGLFREIVTTGLASGPTGTLGTTWPTLALGDLILGASYVEGTQDIPLGKLTTEQYQSIAEKGMIGPPMYFAPDGGALVYFWPQPYNTQIKLRTREAISSFTDLDTVYLMPRGYEAAFTDLLAEVMAPDMGGITPAIARNAAAARATMTAQALNPAIIGGNLPAANILSGWR